MTTEPELDKLIIENMADLDAVAKRAEALLEEIWDAMYGHVVAWARTRTWESSDDRDDPWVAPSDWVSEDSSFFVAYGPGDKVKNMEGETYFELSRMAGVGGGRLCLWLGFEGVKPNRWKPLFREAATQASQMGFSFDDVDGFYIDCTPRPGTLAAAVENNDYAAAFEPLTRALDTAHEHWLLFDALLKKVRA